MKLSLFAERKGGDRIPSSREEILQRSGGTSAKRLAPLGIMGPSPRTPLNTADNNPPRESSGTPTPMLRNVSISDGQRIKIAPGLSSSLAHLN